MKKKEKINISSKSLEDFMYMSWRYCIGRHTIAAAHHAGTIFSVIKSNPDLFSEERKIFNAEDIRNEINTTLNFKEFIQISGFPKHDIYSEMLYRISEFDNTHILHIHYDNYYKEWHIEDTKKPLHRSMSSNYDYIDLLPWTRLANWLDSKCHKIIKVRYEGKESEIECYPFPYRISEGKFEERWSPMDSMDSYLAPEYIINNED